MKKIILFTVLVMLPSVNSFATSSLKCSNADGTLMRGEEESAGKTTVYYLLWGSRKYYQDDKKLIEVSFDEPKKLILKQTRFDTLDGRFEDISYVIPLTAKVKEATPGDDISPPTTKTYEDSGWVICHLKEYPEVE
ncbi:MAG: hypothetical protein A3F16_00310 [Deltaproteobacteria bacterium RIFCSPHIGHO2_12_FULL_43_9]|nr:MAG: hypothetical protein A3F16_00310 [Deltaproteobacteria bacterium RIFCSPHIGHO2_12_FULL_43_9]